MVFGLMTLALISSISLLPAQSYNGITILFCDYDLCSYTVDTGFIHLRGDLHDGSPPWFRFGSANDSSVHRASYEVLFSAFFEANDTNSDGIFLPDQDEYVGSLVPLLKESHNWLNWSWDDQYDDEIIKRDEQNQITTALHFNYTTEFEYSHQAPETNTTVLGWTNIDGRSDPMDLKIELRMHFYLHQPNQFTIELSVDGWKWTYDDSILVFVVEIAEYIETDEGTDRTQNLNINLENNTFSFGEAWLEYAPTASTDNATDQVQVNGSQGPFDPVYTTLDNVPYFHSKELEGNATFIAFENYGDDTLEYDPIIGVGPPMNLTIPSTPSQIGYAQLLVTAGLISVMVIVVLFIRETNGPN